MSKRPRTLDGFLGLSASKKSRSDCGTPSAETYVGQTESSNANLCQHPSYPFALPKLPVELAETLNFAPATEGRIINDQPDLDLLYFEPYIPKLIEKDLFEFLRRELFFYRVQYQLKRGSFETQINTPRFTTVFGLDDTARFNDSGNVIDANNQKLLPSSTYRCRPRPIPACLDVLRVLTENTTGCTFNFVLVNYYATGNDSISYHSDDEKFLGTNPAIASFSLGGKRDFLLRHKPTPSKYESETKPLKLPLASGDMILMRGKTQSNWLHSIPKRKGGESDRGRINITFRKAMVKGGTENYYRYNVGDGQVFKWNDDRREMVAWY